MQKQVWAIKLKSGDIVQVKSNFKPKGSDYLEVLPGVFDEISGVLESSEWLQIENIERDDEPGVFDRVVTVNQDLKDSILSSREAEKEEKESIRSAELDSYKSLKTALLSLKRSDLSNSDKIKDAILGLRDGLAILEKEIYNLKTD